MKFIFHLRRPALALALVTFGALALGLGPAPAAHAASNPQITATGGDAYVSVGGTGFTPKGNVVVKVFSSSGKFESSTHVTALGPHFVCHTYPFGTLCGTDPGGEISAAFTAGSGTVHVIARDLSTGLRSNRATTFVYPIP